MALQKDCFYVTLFNDESPKTMNRPTRTRLTAMPGAVDAAAEKKLRAIADVLGVDPNSISAILEGVSALLVSPDAVAPAPAPSPVATSVRSLKLAHRKANTKREMKRGSR